ncbi:hypothetical protein DYD21_07815 [Rhodohalobacter sp. SW132]|uniref:hypothetical protein n=1 Tax=Rhodohalobacter sp. SW132 TaxID=2293433 RepID=UPI000E27FA8E|nr:hypothetical protein [Rhodohalobacter sp. SW132]REL37682.1 hypothetical protein DYD21_07815 [Rhodohalobacter sp. SW132]
MTDYSNCIFCKDTADFNGINANEKFEVNCERCGIYKIYNSAIALLQEKELSQPHLISAFIREKTEKGIKLELDINEIEDLDDKYFEHDPFEIFDKIMLFFYRRCEKIIEKIEIDHNKDYPIAYAENSTEFIDYLRKLSDLGYIFSQGAAFNNFIITLEGWKYIQELRKRKPENNQAFVAMWFSEEMNNAWENGFHKALDDLNLNPFRIDMLEHNDKICDEIIAQINRSNLLVADFTDNRGGVYFEAGYALGLGIPVIWTCREDYIDKTHFDTRQYNHIVWETPEDLHKKLTNRILATIPFATNQNA